MRLLCYVPRHACGVISAGSYVSPNKASAIAHGGSRLGGQTHDSPSNRLRVREKILRPGYVPTSRQYPGDSNITGAQRDRLIFSEPSQEAYGVTHTEPSRYRSPPPSRAAGHSPLHQRPGNAPSSAGALGGRAYSPARPGSSPQHHSNGASPLPVRI